MENGVEKYPPLITKTAHGEISQFKLIDNVVQVDEDKQDEPPTEEEEEETKDEPQTNTSHAPVSHINMPDKPLHLFHAHKDSEVFEDAIMDHHNTPPQQQSDQPHEADYFEQAIHINLPTEDTYVTPYNLHTLETVEPHATEPNVQVGGQDGKHPSAMDVDVDVEGETKTSSDNDVDLSGNFDAAVCEDSFLTRDDLKVVEDIDIGTEHQQEAASDGVLNDLDDHDNNMEGESEESKDVVCNKEEDENGASALISHGETNPSIEAEVELNGSYSALVHDYSDNGGSKNSELEEKPVDLAKSLDLGSAVFGKRVPFEGNRPDEQQILLEDGQCISGSLDATVCGKTENGKIRNGDLEKLELKQKPAVTADFSDVGRADSDEIDLSDENESGEKMLSQEYDQSCKTRDTEGNVDTILNKNQKPEIRDVPFIVGDSINEGAGKKTKHPDTMVEKLFPTDAAESEEKDTSSIQAQHTRDNIEESSGILAVVKEPEPQDKQGEVKKEGSSSVEESQASGSAREPRIHTSVEPNPAPPRRPAGLGGAAPLFEPAPRALQQPRVNGAAPVRQAQLVEDPMNGESEENDETREKLQMIRVKFLRLAHRLGQTPHNVVVAQVLYRLGLAEQLRGRNAGRVGAFSFDRASAMAEQLESTGQEPLDFSCTIMVLGKTGVGKSATINSIFDEIKFSTDAFQMGTQKVQDVVGTVQGIKVRVIDTPGLLPCWSDQRHNEKILHSVKRFIKKTPPDIVLYLDRLDMQSRDFGDLPLLRTITEIFGPSIWFNAIVVLTHAASAPPDGPNGVSSSYEMFVTQRSHVVQQAIRQAAGDMRLMNPVSLVENHSACRTNRAGQRVLPNGQVWKPHLLLLSFASKILAEANTLLKLQDNPPGKPFATRPRVPPLPFLLSSLLQSRPQLKLPEEQFGDEDDLDEDLDESSDSEDESEYDELPAFKRLTEVQLAKLSKAQKKAYFDELEYREKLFMKKQLREEKKRRKLLKKMAGLAKEVPNDYTENAEEESGNGASVPVAMPDFSLPASFDSDNPSHRYRFLDTSNLWLVRPVLETHGWDHDVGYEGINVERLFVVKDKIPLSFSGQATKDKKESNLQMELASSIKHNEGKATSVGFDMQTIGKDMSYTLRSETRFSNFRYNKTAAGLSVTLLGDALTAGVKLEDKLIVNKRFRLVLTGGAMTGRGDVAYGGSLEATLRDKDYPLGRMLSTLGLSIMDWHGDLAIGCNVQSQIPIGRSSNLIARANLNNRGSGQISIRTNSSEQLQIALVGLLPLFRKALSLYQQTRYGE